MADMQTPQTPMMPVQKKPVKKSGAWHVMMPIAVMAFAIMALIFFIDWSMDYFSNGTVKNTSNTNTTNTAATRLMNTNGANTNAAETE